jgi:hypothetical protein
MFPKSPDDFEAKVYTWPKAVYESNVITAELARRGILDPDGPIWPYNKLVI